MLLLRFDLNSAAHCGIFAPKPSSFSILKWGKGPDPQKIYEEDGYEYLQNEFPRLSYIAGCVILADADVDEEGEPSERKTYHQLIQDEVSDVEL